MDMYVRTYTEVFTAFNKYITRFNTATIYFNLCTTTYLHDDRFLCLILNNRNYHISSAISLSSFVTDVAAVKLVFKNTRHNTPKRN